MAVGSVYVDVVPSTQGFVRKMANDLEREGDALGKKLGQRIADGVGKNIGRRMSGSLAQLTDFSRVGDAAEQAGKKAGQRYSQALVNQARQATADLRKLTDTESRITARLEINKSELDNVKRSLADLGNDRIHVGIDVDDAELRNIGRDLLDQKRELEVKVDVDEVGLDDVNTRIDRLGEKAQHLPRIRFDADYRQLDEAGNRVNRLANSIVKADDSTQRFMSKPKEYALLATAAFTPASAAVLAFAAAGLAVIAPVAAIAAGIDGIKLAVAPLNSNLQLLQSNVDAAFVTGLQPVVGSIGRLFPALNSGLTGTASALSGVAVQMTGVAASASNVDLLDGIFRNMNEAITGLGPPMGTLVDNTLKFADIGSSAMVTLGPVLTEVGAAWTDMINALRDTGAGEAAVIALIQVIGSLLTLAAPLVQLGAEMFQAIGPGLAAGINGVAAVVSVLANAFGNLPGPLQTVIATALILRAVLALTGRTMGGLVFSLGQLASRANQSLTSPFRAASAAMSAYDARTRGAGEQLALFGGRAEEAGRKAGNGAKVASKEMGSFATGATRALDGVANGVLAASYKVEGGFKRTAEAGRTFGAASGAALERVGHAFYTLQGVPSQVLGGLQTGYIRAGLEAQAFADRSRGALTQAQVGYNRVALAGEDFAQRTVRAISNTGAAFLTLARNPSQALPMLERGYIRAQLAGETFATRSNAALDRVRAGFSQLTAGPMAAITALSTGMTVGGQGFAQYAQAAEQGASRTRTSVSTIGTSVSSSMNTASGAATAGAGRIRSALSTIGEGATTAIGQSFSKIGDLATQGMNRAGQAVSSGASRVSQGLSTLAGAAARAGTGIAAGFGKALGGIMDALGGPWGAALTAAMVLLSLFGDAMAKNSQKQAEFQQSVRDTAEALRESAGAITDQMRANEFSAQSMGTSRQAAQDLGLELGSLTNTAINGGMGWEELKGKLEATATAGREVQYGLTDMGGALTDTQMAIVNQGSAAQTLLDNLGPLKAKYEEAAAANQAYEFAIRNSGNSMTAGLGVTSQLTAAFTTLQSAMSTTADKASALSAALQLLFGQPLSAEAALAQAKLNMTQLGDAMKKAKDEAAGLGQGMLTTSGRINLNTKAGQELAIAMNGAGASFAEASTRAFDAAGGTQNLAAAQQSARSTAQGLRDSFVATFTQMTGNAQAANTYADELGLIPDVIVTLLSMNTQGLDRAKQDLALLTSQIKSLPPGQTTVTATISGEAADLLRKAGVGVIDLGNGQFQVEANDRTRPIIDGILAYITGRKAEVPVGANPSQIPPQVEGAVASANPPPVPVQPDTSKIPPAIVRDVGGAKPPPVPVQGDTAPLANDVNAATSGLPAAQIDVVLRNVNDIEAGINRIRQNLSAPITMTLNLQNNIGAGTDAYQQLQNKTVTLTLALVNGVGTAAADAFRVENKTATLTLALANGIGDGARAAMAVENKTVTLTLGLVNGIGDGARAAMAIESKSVTLTLGLVNNIGAGATTAMAVQSKTVTLTLTLQDGIGRVPVERFAIEGKTVTLTLALKDGIGNVPIERFSIQAKTVTLTLALTDNIRNIPTERFNQVTNKTVTLTLNLVDNIGDRARQAFAIESKTVTLTTRYVTQGAPPPPNAAGNIYGNAKGGMYAGHKLTPMTGGVARKVQANSWRVVGDRTSKPESYIPWNNSGRSKALLATTAKAFGYALQPMANGGVAASETLRLAQLARERIGTQTVGAMQGAQSTSSTTEKASKQQSVQLAEMTALLRDSLAQPRTITVEDRSGNPVETARRTVLAQRLAR